jgi:hypothetical protein
MKQSEIDQEIVYWREHGLPATQNQVLIDLLTEDRRRSREAMEIAREQMLTLLDDTPRFPNAVRHDTAVALHGIATALDNDVELKFPD